MNGSENCGRTFFGQIKGPSEFSANLQDETLSFIFEKPLAKHNGRLAEFDIPLVAGVGIAVVLALDALTASESRPWNWFGAYLALLFAFLAKGVPALMFFGPGLLLAACVTSSWRRLFSVGHVLGGVELFDGTGPLGLACLAGRGVRSVRAAVERGRCQGAGLDV